MSFRWLVPTITLSLVLAVSLVAQPATTFTVVNNGFTSYMIDGSSNPTLNLTRGQTYVFQVNSPGHPFWIKSVQSTGTGNAFSNGVTNNGTDSGTVTFAVPMSAPATLFYNCQFHSPMTGQLKLSDSVPTRQQTWGQVKATYR